jgi:hypothetical protein
MAKSASAVRTTPRDRGALSCVLFCAMALGVGCGRDGEKRVLGCAPEDVDFRQQLAMAGETPWCHANTRPREAYRFVWGQPHLPVVIAVSVLGDSAVVTAYVSEIQEGDFVYPRRDTTYTLHPGKFRYVIRGDDWRPGEPSSTGFTKALWKTESIEPTPFRNQQPIWALESIRNGRYRASVRWRLTQQDARFRRTAYAMAELAVAGQHISTDRGHVPRP